MNNRSYIKIGGFMIIEECEDKIIHNDKISLAKKKMLSDDVIFEVSNLYKVFSDETRLRILNALLNSELCVCDISEVLEMTHSSISHQLKILRDMKLVKKRKAGKSVYYSLIDSHIQKIIEIGVEHINEKDD